MKATLEINSYLQLIRQALDASAIVAITDPTGNIIEVNDKFCEISKYSRAELIGKNHRVINSGYHSKEFFSKMWQTILSGQKWEGEIRNRAKDGTYYWVHTHIVPFLNSDGSIKEFVSIRYDITERKATEQNLNTLLNSYTDGLLIYDLSGNIKWCNDTAQGLLAPDKDLKNEAVENILGNEFKIFETGQYRMHWGSPENLRSFEVVSKNYTHHNRAAYLVSIRDVSERIREEAKLIQQDRLASIGVMASGLAHEIGTPLGVIRGRAEMIAQGVGNVDFMKSSAETIMQQIDRVSHLVRSLLKLARGEDSLAVQPVHILSLLNDIHDFIHHEFSKQKIELQVSIPDSVMVRAVYTSLFQIFLNLLVNASHAIQEKRKSDSELLGLIQIHCEVSEKNMIISVTDNGCGMSTEQMQKIFTPFFTTKAIGQGTGLGLVTSYQMLQSWNGFFSVSSVLGKGATFSLHFPR